MPRRNSNAGMRTNNGGGGSKAAPAFFPEPFGANGVIASWDSLNGWSLGRPKFTNGGYMQRRSSRGSK